MKTGFTPSILNDTNSKRCIWCNTLFRKDIHYINEIGEVCNECFSAPDFKKIFIKTVKYNIKSATALKPEILNFK